MERIENLLKICLEDDENEKQFNFIIEDDVYDGPDLGLYGGFANPEDSKTFKEEYYTCYDERFNTSSCIHLFPVFEEFKSKFTTLSKSYLIYHNITITINENDYTLNYQVYNFSEGFGTFNIIEMTRILSKNELMTMMVNVLEKYKDLCITNIYAEIYQF